MLLSNFCIFCHSKELSWLLCSFGSFGTYSCLDFQRLGAQSTPTSIYNLMARTDWRTNYLGICLQGHINLFFYANTRPLRKDLAAACELAAESALERRSLSARQPNQIHGRCDSSLRFTSNCWELVGE